jgi:hypothetical protein
VVDALKNSKIFGAKKISWKVIRSTPMFHDLNELYLMAAKNNVIRVGDGKTKYVCGCICFFRQKNC